MWARKGCPILFGLPGLGPAPSYIGPNFLLIPELVCLRTMCRSICHLVLPAVLTPVFCSGSEAAAVSLPRPYPLTLPWAQCQPPRGEGTTREPRGWGA